jgi:hypothetical protein
MVEVKSGKDEVRELLSEQGRSPVFWRHRHTEKATSARQTRVPAQDDDRAAEPPLLRGQP